MTIKSAVVDYAGRQVDVELLQTITYPTGSREVVVSNVASTPKIVTGVQKALQRYTTLLLTVLGDVHFVEDEGTGLVQAFASGNIANNGILQYVFVDANTSVLTMMREDDNDITTFGTIPDDERIAAAVLVSYAVDYANGVVGLTIQFTMQSGSDIVYVIPVATPR